LNGDKRQQLTAMFGRIARGYDRLNSVISLGMHHRWRRFAVRQCRLSPDGLALDVGAGTADFMIEALASGESAGRRAVGVDPCVPMLAIGAEKLRRRGLDRRAQLLVGEAERLPVGSDRFDCAVSGFTLRNVSDIDATFAEMARAVRPGGRVVTLEIAKPPNAVFRSLFLLYFYHLSPWVARICGGDRQAYRYLPASLKIFKSREELVASMERGGLVDICVHDLWGGSVTVHVGTKPG
jgi:demethylmenaquinone methyltransferase/2-methoxy-6-polyprenyl-1,4-benzoquinol methylase